MSWHGEFYAFKWRTCHCSKICIFCLRCNFIIFTFFKESNILQSSANVVRINLSYWAVYILSNIHGFPHMHAQLCTHKYTHTHFMYHYVHVQHCSINLSYNSKLTKEQKYQGILAMFSDIIHPSLTFCIFSDSVQCSWIQSFHT